MEYRLLEKTEIWIGPVKLTEADLGACARAAAQVLGLNPDEIMVTDVLGDTMTLDILVPTVNAKQIVAQKEELLKALTAVPGIHLTSETEIHSDGILGLISLDKESGREVLERSASMSEEIAERIQKRAMVFATGGEVLNGQIRDTNTPFLIETLQGEGYNVVKGPIMEDDVNAIAGGLFKAVEEGYGLLVTTGGVGAEGKDQTLEALARLDPDASTPYILKFQKGTGRHRKDGVRIGVGELEWTLIVCLPGPNDEVQLVWPSLKEGLKANWDKKSLAEVLANVLRQKFLNKNLPHAVSHDDKAE